MKTFADSGLNLNAQALAVLAILANLEPGFDGEDYDSTSSAWYNGRERGVCLVIRRWGAEKCLCIVFGECRSSDSLFIETWTHKGHFMNPPRIEDRPEKAYQSRETVAFGRIDLVVSKIVNMVEKFVDAEDKRAAKAERKPAQILPNLGESS